MVKRTISDHSEVSTSTSILSTPSSNVSSPSSYFSTYDAKGRFGSFDRRSSNTSSASSVDSDTFSISSCGTLKSPSMSTDIPTLSTAEIDSRYESRQVLVGPPAQALIEQSGILDVLRNTQINAGTGSENSGKLISKVQVLDFACGTGTVTSVLQKLVSPLAREDDDLEHDRDRSVSGSSGTLRITAMDDSVAEIAFLERKAEREGREDLQSVLYKDGVSMVSFR